MALVAPLIALLAACGSTASTSAATANASAAGAAPVPAASVPAASSAVSASAMPNAFPVTIDGANGPLTLKAAPEKIVSMSPTATEMLFAIGAGTQVEAVDDQSTFPTDAPKTKLSAFQPNAEAVAGYTPDLVVISNDANGLVASLTKLKVPALVLPAATTLDESYAQMTALGKATGHEDDAAKVVAETKARIAKAVASASASVRQSKGKKVYHELDQTYYSLTRATFVGSIYSMFGLTNIADKASDAAASGGYPKLSAEYVVSAAPELIVLADSKCCQQDAATVAKRPGFAQVPAVKNGKVIAVDDDIASRWGPRTADFAEAIAKALQP